jgi:hypothetical protein
VKIIEDCKKVYLYRIQRIPVAIAKDAASGDTQMCLFAPVPDTQDRDGFHFSNVCITGERGAQNARGRHEPEASSGCGDAERRFKGAVKIYFRYAPALGRRQG